MTPPSPRANQRAALCGSRREEQYASPIVTSLPSFSALSDHCASQLPLISFSLLHLLQICSPRPQILQDTSTYSAQRSKSTVQSHQNTKSPAKLYCLNSNPKPNINPTTTPQHGRPLPLLKLPPIHLPTLHLRPSRLRPIRPQGPLRLRRPHHPPQLLRQHLLPTIQHPTHAILLPAQLIRLEIPRPRRQPPHPPLALPLPSQLPRRRRRPPQEIKVPHQRMGQHSRRRRSRRPHRQRARPRPPSHDRRPSRRRVRRPRVGEATRAAQGEEETKRWW